MLIGACARLEISFEISHFKCYAVWTTNVVVGRRYCFVDKFVNRKKKEEKFTYSNIEIFTICNKINNLWISRIFNSFFTHWVISMLFTFIFNLITNLFKFCLLKLLKYLLKVHILKYIWICYTIWGVSSGDTNFLKIYQIFFINC